MAGTHLLSSKEDELLHYALAFRIPTEISKPFIRKVLLWSRCSGDEWTVSRLKDIKLDIIRLKAGLSPSSDHLSFTGLFSGLISFGSKNRRNWSKLIAFLQAYTLVYSPSITIKQELKSCLE